MKVISVKLRLKHVNFTFWNPSLLSLFYRWELCQRMYVADCRILNCGYTDRLQSPLLSYLEKFQWNRLYVCPSFACRKYHRWGRKTNTFKCAPSFN